MLLLLLLLLLQEHSYRKLWEINAYEAISHWQRKLQQIQFRYTRKMWQIFYLSVSLTKFPSIPKEAGTGKSNKSLAKISKSFVLYM